MLSLERQEHYRRRYAVENPGWRPATHDYRDRVAAHLTAATRVLDLGCGRGGVIEELYDKVSLSVGLDPDWPSLCDHRTLGLPRACGMAQRIPFDDAAFDVICCSWVLEHLPSPGRVLNEVSRTLVPGGHFVFLTPNRRHPLLAMNRVLQRSSTGWVGRLYGRSEADTFPAVYRANTPARIRALVEAAGLEPVALIAVGDPTYLAFHPALFRLACLLERLIPPTMRVHLVGEARKGGS